MKRLFLVLAAAAFLGWLGWLAFAVSKAGSVPIVSRAQLTAATDLVVVKLTRAPDGPPNPVVDIVQVLSGEHVKPGTSIKVENMREAKVFAGHVRVTPEAEKEYFVPLAFNGGLFKVAGLPNSPGYSDLRVEFPVLYPWGDEVKAQLKSLAILK